MRKNCSKDVSREHRIEILFVFGVFLFYFLWSCTQRYNFSADESMRYQIAQFIYKHGSLPRGDDPSGMRTGEPPMRLIPSFLTWHQPF